MIRRSFLVVLACALLGTSIGVNVWQYRHRLVAVIVIPVPAGPCQQRT